MSVILVNAIITPDGTRLTSTHNHDYQSYIDANGETYMVDGGTTYIRRSVNEIPATDASVTTDDPHEVIRDTFTWGSYGKDGAGPKTRITLANLESEHIAAIVDTQKLSPEVRAVFATELAFRNQGSPISYTKIEKPEPPKRVVVLENVNFRVLELMNAMNRACPIILGFLLGYLIGELT